MTLLISFIPWFLFWAFAIHGKLELAAISGFLSLGVILIKNRAGGHRTKSLELGTLIFFVLFAIAVPVLGRKMIERNIDLLGNSAVVIVILATIILKKPFTIDFAKEKIAPAFWENADFIRVNYQISLFWLAVLSFNLSLVAARHFSLIRLEKTASILIRILICVLAALTTKYYIKYKRSKRSRAG